MESIKSLQIKNIGVITSGGDAPGMNAAIRAVVRTAYYYNLYTTGVIRGYDGLINNTFIHLDTRTVGNIIQRGGTILKTARSMGFFTREGRQQAYDNLRKRRIDALVVIGGDGSFSGAKVFGEEFDFPVIGLPGTIDNDLVGTDFTIGYDSAINTAVQAMDKIRDTAESHNRLFLVEVMGRDSGLIALRSGIGAGAESILIPETKTTFDSVLLRLQMGRQDKSSKIIIVAEGERNGGAYALMEHIKAAMPELDIRLSVLGHLQRGGSPTCMDRVVASRLGVAAVEALLRGEKGVMMGQVNKQIISTPFTEAIKHNDPDKVAREWMKYIEILSL